MAIINVITRPQPYPCTQWEGDNLAELNDHYTTAFGFNVSFQVNGLGQLIREELPFGDTTPVPESKWFSHAFMGTYTTEEIQTNYQEITDNPPYIFNVTGTP